MESTSKGANIAMGTDSWHCARPIRLSSTPYFPSSYFDRVIEDGGGGSDIIRIVVITVLFTKKKTFSAYLQ